MALRPYWIDAHPDHVAATELIEAARFWSKLTKTDLPGEPHHPQRIYNYYCIHLKQALQPAFVLDITAEWDRKLASCGRTRASSSPAGRRTPPTFFEHFEAEAAYWGKTIGGVWRAVYEPRADWDAVDGGAGMEADLTAIKGFTVKKRQRVK